MKKIINKKIKNLTLTFNLIISAFLLNFTLTSLVKTAKLTVVVVTAVSSSSSFSFSGDDDPNTPKDWTSYNQVDPALPLVVPVNNGLSNQNPPENNIQVEVIDANENCRELVRRTNSTAGIGQVTQDEVNRSRTDCETFSVKAKKCCSFGECNNRDFSNAKAEWQEYETDRSRGGRVKGGNVTVNDSKFRVKGDESSGLSWSDIKRGIDKGTDIFASYTETSYNLLKAIGAPAAHLAFAMANSGDTQKMCELSNYKDYANLSFTGADAFYDHQKTECNDAQEICEYQCEKHMEDIPIVRDITQCFGGDQFDYHDIFKQPFNNDDDGDSRANKLRFSQLNIPVVCDGGYNCADSYIMNKSCIENLVSDEYKNMSKLLDNTVDMLHSSDPDHFKVEYIALNLKDESPRGLRRVTQDTINEEDKIKTEKKEIDKKIIKLFIGKLKGQNHSIEDYRVIPAYLISELFYIPLNAILETNTVPSVIHKAFTESFNTVVKDEFPSIKDFDMEQVADYNKFYLMNRFHITEKEKVHGYFHKGEIPKGTIEILKTRFGDDNYNTIVKIVEQIRSSVEGSDGIQKLVKAFCMDIEIFVVGETNIDEKSVDEELTNISKKDQNIQTLLSNLGGQEGFLSRYHTEGKAVLVFPPYAELDNSSNSDPSELNYESISKAFEVLLNYSKQDNNPLNNLQSAEETCGDVTKYSWMNVGKQASFDNFWRYQGPKVCQVARQMAVGQPQMPGDTSSPRSLPGASIIGGHGAPETLSPMSYGDGNSEGIPAELPDDEFISKPPNLPNTGGFVGNKSLGDSSAGGPLGAGGPSAGANGNYAGNPNGAGATPYGEDASGFGVKPYGGFVGSSGKVASKAAPYNTGASNRKPQLKRTIASLSKDKVKSQQLSLNSLRGSGNDKGRSIFQLVSGSIQNYCREKIRYKCM